MPICQNVFSIIIVVNHLKPVNNMPVGTVIVHLRFPGCASLKEKRSSLKPILHRLHREFNLSTAEIDYCDIWQDALIACACINRDHVVVEKELHAVSAFIEKHFPDTQIVDEHIDIF